ncbi:Ger(x)C family spore germination protein [Paenibacillus sacheonensis]|uniref:Ger(X)C family spore germination protein n=1 Tax=Paenibacillus sacheonensis TaxID=742054 RepID=A0A7X4YNH9_9BACL|nr:Ger(x)C family spore germination protein [Paenibacillus sacheonensis]MBM7565437.1 spore germination protein KC [Paenibacillus sacheonensis]NBC69635.1 Ger(x)C family spore germination protein [Paenibacillus sacheonensis]
MKRVRLPLLLLMLLLPLTSSCGFRDIDKRFFVIAMGIDQPSNGAKGFNVTLRLAVPSPKIEPGSGKNQVVSIQATSIAEAVRLLKAHVDKELDFGHCKVFMLGEGLARNNHTDMLRWLSRRRDVQSVAYMAIGHPDAKSILNIAPPDERYPGNTLFLMFGKDGTQSSYLVPVYVFDFIRRTEERGIDPVLPIIRAEGKSYVITRLALLDKTKLVETITPAQTETYSQIRNQDSKSTVAAVKDGDTMVINVDRISSHYKIVKANGEHVLRLHLRVSGIFEEAPLGIYEANWDKLEELFNEQIASEIEKLFKKVQHAGVDPFGFGLRYRATHAGSPQTWKDWERIYPNLKFDIHVRVKIDGTGLVK